MICVVLLYSNCVATFNLSASCIEKMFVRLVVYSLLFWPSVLQLSIGTLSPLYTLTVPNVTVGYSRNGGKLIVSYKECLGGCVERGVLYCFITSNVSQLENLKTFLMLESSLKWWKAEQRSKGILNLCSFFLSWIISKPFFRSSQCHHGTLTDSVLGQLWHWKHVSSSYSLKSPKFDFGREIGRMVCTKNYFVGQLSASFSLLMLFPLQNVINSNKWNYFQNSNSFFVWTFF